MLRIGTRGSRLALAQSGHMADALARVTGTRPELLVVRTGGDRDQTSPLPSFGGAGCGVGAGHAGAGGGA